MLCIAEGGRNLGDEIKLKSLQIWIQNGANLILQMYKWQPIDELT